jgi:hypothetical protein
MLEETTVINRKTARKILVKVWERKKVCACSVPYLLTPHQKHQCPASFREFVKIIDADINVLKTNLRGDESSMYDLETKRQRRNFFESKGTESSENGNAKIVSENNVVYISYAKGIFHRKCVTATQTANGK